MIEILSKHHNVNIKAIRRGLAKFGKTAVIRSVEPVQAKQATHDDGWKDRARAKGHEVD